MLQTQCSVCEKSRKYKTLVFDEALNAYCLNAHECSDRHPNTIQSIKSRGFVMEFYNYEEALNIQQQKSKAMYEEGATSAHRHIRNVDVDRMLDTLSFRVKTQIQAEYLAYLMGKEGIRKISPLMQYLIDEAIERDLEFKSKLTAHSYTSYKPSEPVPTPTPKPIPKPVAKPIPSPTIQNEDVFTI